MSFIVSTKEFQGPLDLMLHLVRENELDLFDLNISILTDQYLNYINKLKELKLEIESEYLVELATLIEYKSKKILPIPQEELEGEYEEDPALRLANRLIMYQKYKDVTAELEKYYYERQTQYSKSLTDLSEMFKTTNDAKYDLTGTPYDLIKAMNKVMRKFQLIQPIDVVKTQKEISIEERILQIKAKIGQLPKTFSFENITEDCNNLITFIVTFLSILEMIKQQYLLFTIDDNETIWFTRRLANEQV